MNLAKYKSGIMFLIAVLWIVCMFLGWYNYFVPAMVLGVVLMFLHLLLGVSHNDVISKKFLVYPILAWAVLWIVSFILSQYFALKFADQMPTFTVLGFHPSFAPTVFLYWIGGMVTLTAGFSLFRDHWLSDEQWENFLKKVQSNKEE